MSERLDRLVAAVEEANRLRDAAHTALVVAEHRVWLLATLSPDDIVHVSGPWGSHDRRTMWEVDGVDVLVDNDRADDTTRATLSFHFNENGSGSSDWGYGFTDAVGFAYAITRTRR